MKRHLDLLLSITLIWLTYASGAGAAETRDQQAIRNVLNEECAAYAAGDSARAVSFYLPSVTVFDITLPAIKNHDQVVKSNQDILNSLKGPVTCTYETINSVELTPEFAYSAAILRIGGTLKTGKTFSLRILSTDIYQKVAGKWRVMHEHNSVPIDVTTGAVDPSFQRQSNASVSGTETGD